MSPFRLPSLLVALGSMAGCQSLTGSSTREDPAVLVSDGDTTAIEAPEVVTAGVVFGVTLRTFGGGCTREVSRTHVATSPGSISIHPFNKSNVGEDVTCAMDVRILTHSVRITATDAGPLLLRVQGLDGRSGGLIVLERTIAVQ